MKTNTKFFIFFSLIGLALYSQGGDIYYAGDWNGDGITNIAVRRGAQLYYDIDGDGTANGIQDYGNGDLEINGRKDIYLVGDWDGDKKDNLAVRRGNAILMDINFDGAHDLQFSYGNGDSEDEYLVGDWDGDGKDNIAVRRNNAILMDFNYDGTADKTFAYGNGDSEDKYLVGDWDGDGKDNIAVRRNNAILMDYNYDGAADKTFSFGNGNSEHAYLVGDWDGDKKDNIAVLRGISLLMDTNFDGAHDKEQAYGNGMTIEQEGGGFFEAIGNVISAIAGAVIDVFSSMGGGFGNSATIEYSAGAYISNDYRPRTNSNVSACHDLYYENKHNSKKIAVTVKYSGSIFDTDCSTVTQQEIITKTIPPGQKLLFYSNIGGNVYTLDAKFID